MNGVYHGTAQPRDCIKARMAGRYTDIDWKVQRCTVKHEVGEELIGVARE